MTTTPGTPGPIPVLLYHCVAPDPSAWIAPFTVSAAALRRHLEIITASGRTPITLSQLRDGIGGQAALPAQPVVITFDEEQWRAKQRSHQCVPAEARGDFL